MLSHTKPWNREKTPIKFGNINIKPWTSKTLVIPQTEITSTFHSNSSTFSLNLSLTFNNTDTFKYVSFVYLLTCHSRRIIKFCVVAVNGASGRRRPRQRRRSVTSRAASRRLTGVGTLPGPGVARTLAPAPRRPGGRSANYTSIRKFSWGHRGRTRSAIIIRGVGERRWWETKYQKRDNF